MTNQRYSPEFKDEAVRQIVERGYSVAEVSKRLGVSAHSLYKWVKGVRPSQTDGSNWSLGKNLSGISDAIWQAKRR